MRSQSSEQIFSSRVSLNNNGDFNIKQNSQLPNNYELPLEEIQALSNMQPNFDCSYLQDQKLSKNAFATFDKQGPLNLTKLVAQGWIKITRDNYKKIKIIPYDFILQNGEDCSQYGQLQNNELDGIARRIGYSGKIFEGQFKRGNQSGWGRRILADGTFHVGWFKGGMAHGYGIGNAYTNNKGIKSGFYQEQKFKEDGNISYDKDAPFARRFSLIEVGLEKPLNKEMFSRKSTQPFPGSKSLVNLIHKNISNQSSMSSIASQSTQITETTFKVPKKAHRFRTPKALHSNESRESKQYIPLRGHLENKTLLMISSKAPRPPKPPRTIKETKSKVKQLIEFKSVFKSGEFSSRSLSESLPRVLNQDELKACEQMQPFFNSSNLIDQRSRVKASTQFKKHGPLNLKKLVQDGWLKFKKDVKDKGIIYSETLVDYKQTSTYGSMTNYGQLNSNKEDGICRRIETDPGLFQEGQFINGLLSGWGREIYDDGTYHIGWFKDGKAHGFGIGNRYTNVQGTNKGFYENGWYKSENLGIFKRSSLYATKFTFEQIGLKKIIKDHENLRGQDITPRPKSQGSFKSRF